MITVAMIVVRLSTMAEEENLIDPEEINPNDVVPEYETDLSSWGTNREAAPPDGVNQDWTELHPNAAAEIFAAWGGQQQ